MPSVLFVCLGNICRSPAAEGALRSLCEREGNTDQYLIDSAGTAGWHAGAPPDPRVQAAAKQAGMDISNLSARRVVEDDFFRFDLIVAMDSQNLMDLRAMRPKEATAQLVRLLEYDPDGGARDVPDPYYEDDEAFAVMLTLMEPAIRALHAALRRP